MVRLKNDVCEFVNFIRTYKFVRDTYPMNEGGATQTVGRLALFVW